MSPSRPSGGTKKTRTKPASVARCISLLMILSFVTAIENTAYGEQPPPPCHPNPNETQDRATVTSRDDIVNLPAPLQDRLIQLAERPHTFLPLQVYAEADGASQLFQYYLLDTTGFEPNVFTTIIPRINDTAQLTVTGANCGLSTVGAVRVVLEPKPGLPTDPNDPRAFIDIFTDISGLFVINNESGWYEGWMIHDLNVPEVEPPRPDGHAQFGTITDADAAALKKMGSGNNIPGNTFTLDGKAVRLPSVFDHFPDVQTNVVPIYLSMGAYNSLQQSDAHSYWEFNYLGTNWIHPLYELPFTGGFPDNFGEPPDAFSDGEIGKLPLFPAPGRGVSKTIPRWSATIPTCRAIRINSTPILTSSESFASAPFPAGSPRRSFWMYMNGPASFEPGTKNLQRRLFDAYAAEVARVDTNGDGIISAVEGDIDTASDGFDNNERLFLPPTLFNRFAVTREINDGLLAPRFSPSQRAWILTGALVPVQPAVAASAGRDSDDR